MKPTPEAVTRDLSVERSVQFTEREREFVYAVAMKIMRDEEKAQDVAQDALLLAYRHRDSYRGQSRFTTWLYRIATTTALMHLRKARSQPVHASLEAEVGRVGYVEPAAHESNPEDAFASSEAVEIAGRSLDEMGDKYGAIFAQRFFEGYTETEIAEALRLNVATVKTRAFRARSHVREQLSRAFAVAA